jgi:CRISPR/Cas system-associated exonuclease Cas4 (RecB family)
MPSNFTAWSYSRLSDYKRCPAYAKYKHLDRLPTESGPAADRGTAIHKGAEAFVLRPLVKLLPELRLFKAKLLELRGMRKVVQVEAMWGFDRNWQPIAWNDWKNCWLRIKMDANYLVPRKPVLHMIDWKSGKPKPEEHMEQLKLYGVGGLRTHQHIKEAVGFLHYTDHGPKHDAKLVVKREEEKKLIKFWEGEVKPMFNDRRFAPKPGPHCNWCDFAKAKGGPCRY